MLSGNFDRYDPEVWQEGGITMASPRKPPLREYRILRNAEKWSAVITLGTFVLASAMGAPGIHQFSFFAPSAVAIHQTKLGSAVTEASFAAATPQFEVSPDYWLRLMRSMERWAPLAPDDDGPEPEPAI